MIAIVITHLHGYSTIAAGSDLTSRDGESKTRKQQIVRLVFLCVSED